MLAHSTSSIAPSHLLAFALSLSLPVPPCPSLSLRADDLLRSALFSFSAATSSLASVLTSHTATAPSCADSFWMSRKTGDFVRVQLHASPRHNADGTVAGVVCVVLQEAEALPARPPPEESATAVAAAAAAAASLVGRGQEANKAKRMEVWGNGGVRQSGDVALTAAPSSSSSSLVALEEPRSCLASSQAVSSRDESSCQPVRGDGAVPCVDAVRGDAAAMEERMAGAPMHGRGGGMPGRQHDVEDGLTTVMAGSRGGFEGMGGRRRRGL